MRHFLSLVESILLAAALLPSAPAQRPSPARPYLGFDSNDYPGDDTLPALHQHFAFTGYWLNNPPGAAANSWIGKREPLRSAGFGFLVLWNGRLDKEILAAAHRQTTPQALATRDAADAVQAALREHFPPGAILFLDQEEGGRLLPEQAAYLLAWTEAIARGGYRPGVYASGQPVVEGTGPDGVRRSITTAQDIRAHVAEQHLHQVVLWVAQDACPPANGCVLASPPPAASGTPDALVWQYAQSPRRPALTHACGNTYAADGNCYAPDLPEVPLDLNVASTPDPSNGR